MATEQRKRAYGEAYRNASPAAAQSRASPLMADPLIRNVIDQRTGEMLERYRHTGEKTLDDIAKIPFASIPDRFGEDGRLLSPQDIPLEVGVALRQYVVTADGVRIEMHDKIAALRLLGTHYGLFAERVEVLPGHELVRLIREGRERSLRGAARAGEEGPSIGNSAAPRPPSRHPLITSDEIGVVVGERGSTCSTFTDDDILAPVK